MFTPSLRRIAATVLLTAPFSVVLLASRPADAATARRAPATTVAPAAIWGSTVGGTDDGSTPGVVVVWVSGARITRAAYTNVVDACGVAHTSSRFAPVSIHGGTATATLTDEVSARAATLAIRLGSSTGAATLDLDPGPGCRSSLTHYQLRKTAARPTEPATASVDGIYRGDAGDIRVERGRVVRLRLRVRMQCTTPEGTEYASDAELELTPRESESVALLPASDSGPPRFAPVTTGALVVARTAEPAAGLGNATVVVRIDFRRSGDGGTARVSYDVIGNGPAGAVCRFQGETSLDA